MSESLIEFPSGVLVKEQLLEYIKEGKIGFTPNVDKFQIQMHSIDLRLGYSFMVPKLWGMTEKGREAFLIDYVDDRNRFEIVELEHKQYFEILPKESVVVTSLEEISLPNDLMAVLYPRSSITRRGLAVDLTGIVDAGYAGKLLIPVTNNTSSQIIRVYPGERFCQIVFYPLSGITKLIKGRWYKKDIVVGRVSERKKIEEEYILKGKIKELKQKYKLPDPEKKPAKSPAKK